MAWPEVCLHVLRVLHVAATPQDLIEDFKAKIQLESMTEEGYVRKMKGLHRQLSGVLPRKDALLYTAKNLRDTRVLDRLVERINSGAVTTFNELVDAVTELRRKYIGETNSNAQKPATRPSHAPPARQTVNLIQEVRPVETPLYHQQYEAYTTSYDTNDPLYVEIDCSADVNVNWFEDGQAGQNAQRSFPQSYQAPRGQPPRGQTPQYQQGPRGHVPMGNNPRGPPRSSRQRTSQPCARARPARHSSNSTGSSPAPKFRQ
jgi:nucleoside diphosphate kinase